MPTPALNNHLALLCCLCLAGPAPCAWMLSTRHGVPCSVRTQYLGLRHSCWGTGCAGSGIRAVGVVTVRNCVQTMSVVSSSYALCNANPTALLPAVCADACVAAALLLLQT